MVNWLFDDRLKLNTKAIATCVTVMHRLGLVLNGALKVLLLFKRKPKASEFFHKRGKLQGGREIY